MIPLFLSKIKLLIQGLYQGLFLSSWSLQHQYFFGSFYVLYYTLFIKLFSFKQQYIQNLKKYIFFSDIVNLKRLGHGIKNLHKWYSVFVYSILFSTCVYTCLVLYISSNCNKIFHYNQNHFLALTAEVIETTLRTSSADPPQGYMLLGLKKIL